MTKLSLLATLVMACLPFKGLGILDYKSCFSCDPDYYNSSDVQIDHELDNINMHWVDAIVFVVGGFLALFLSSMVIYSFFRYKKMREPPGDLFFFISVSEFILSCHWIISSGYFMTYPNVPPQTEGNFCQWNAYFSLGAGAAEFSYNCSFCLFLVFKIRNLLKEKSIPKWIFHALCMIIIVLVIVLCKFTGSMGKSIFGTCSVVGISKVPIFGPLILIIYLFLASFSILYFKKRVPNDQKFSQMREDFLNYYYKYVKACAIVWGIQVISIVIAILNCWFWRLDGLQVFITIGNLSKLGTPLILSHIRMQDPFLKNKILKSIRRIKRRWKRKVSSQKEAALVDPIMSLQEFDENEGGDKNDDNLLINPSGGDYTPPTVKVKRDSDSNTAVASTTAGRTHISGVDLEASLESLEDEKEDVWNIDQIRENLKIMLIYTMISGVLMNNSVRKPSDTRIIEEQSMRITSSMLSSSLCNSDMIERNESTIEKGNEGEKKCGVFAGKEKCCQDARKHSKPDKCSNKDLAKKESIVPGSRFSTQDFLASKTSELMYESLVEEMPNIAEHLIDNQFRTFQIKMTVHAPAVFDELLREDEAMINIQESLNLSLNCEAIRKAGSADGGRGGEFFLFSHDNKLIIKTLSKKEINVMKVMLKNYYSHIKKNPDTLITRIYGLFSFERKDIKHKIHIIIMRNICGYPKFTVERLFDMKGSTVDREVLNKRPNADLAKTTLKDIDFLKLEKKIYVDEKNKKVLLKTLIKDAQFFIKQELIDYSLLVVKINRDKWVDSIINDEELTPEEKMKMRQMQKFTRQIYSIPSEKEKGIYYHIGIIDYLQTYDIKKWLERHAKMILKLTRNLDVSSQSPQVYGARFIEFLKNILN